jgi:uncharacterized membrane protein
MIALKRLALSTVLLLALDFAYLTSTKSLFEEQIINIQRVIVEFKPIGALVCYFFLVLGLNYFILQHKKPVLDAFILGLVIYAVYESTNYAIFKKWGIQLAVIDTLWGGILFALTTYLTYLVF